MWKSCREAGRLRSWEAGKLRSREAGKLGRGEAEKLGSWEAEKLGSWEAGKLGSWEAMKLVTILKISLDGTRLKSMVSLTIVGILHQAATPKWSEPIAGLQARIDVERKGNKSDSPKLITYLSLRNVTDSLGTVDIYMSVSNLVLWLENKAGKKLDMTLSGVNGRNGFVPNPFWLQLPFDSSIRMRCDLTGHFPPPKSEFVIESESGLLSVPKGWTGEVYLAGNFVVNDPPHEARSRRWEGKIPLPRVLIFKGKRIVSH